MQIDVYDINLNRIGVFYTWISMVWREEYGPGGKFQLEVQLTDGAVDLLKPWHYCGIRGKDTLMLILSSQIRDNRIVANGFPATAIFKRRISTEVVKQENAEAAMIGLVQNMSPWPCVEAGEAAGLTDKYPNQVSDKTLYDYFAAIGEACDMGMRLRKSGPKLIFECYKPEINPNARYSDDYGNIGNVSYTISDDKLYNVAIVAGAGEGDARVTVVAGNNDLTGAERLEMYVDARNVQPGEDETDEEYRARLVRTGEQKLVEAARINTISFDVSDERAQLGDLVSVYLRFARLHVSVRVTSIEIVSQRNTITRKIGLGTPVLI